MYFIIYNFFKAYRGRKEKAIYIDLFFDWLVSSLGICVITQKIELNTALVIKANYKLFHTNCTII